LAALLAVALAGCGGGGSNPSPSASNNSGAAVDPDSSTAAAPRAPHHRAATPASVRRLRAELRKEFSKAGRDTGAQVYDLTNRRTLFELHDQVKRPPASVEKIYTTIATLDALGSGARFHTKVFGTGHLGAGGVWHGNLYLRGDGDPTFGDGGFNKTWEQGYGPTAQQVADQLRARGIRRVTGQVIGDESLFDQHRGGPATKFEPDTPDYGGQLSALTFDHGAITGHLTPAAFAATELARTLRSQHVKARASKQAGKTPRHARQLAVVLSPPLSVLLRLMDQPSDDLFADLFAKQLGQRYAEGGTIAQGARVIAHIIQSFGVFPRILDGSGLSRDDGSSPAEVVALLRTLWRTQYGRTLMNSLPIVGVNGTTRNIGVKTAAQGHCVAKTGTLNYVTNLAGYCSTRGHHTVAFALFIDGPANWQAIEMITPMVGAIAGMR
jgi:D-alanyl-D-alanine carboxypeptidase/D-alanyl-D-alanine-endopeptidase (penicillin-binding protein 4)